MKGNKPGYSDADWDYLNEYNGILGYIEFGTKKYLELVRKNPIKHYEERFTPEIHDWLNFSNPRIPILNLIADYINDRVKEKNPDREKLRNIINTAQEIIREKWMA